MTRSKFQLSCVALSVGMVLAAQAQAQSSLVGQREAAARLAADAGSPVEVSYSEATGAARFVRLPVGGKLSAARAALQSDAAKQASAVQFLNEYAALFGIKDAGAELASAVISKDPQGGSHLRYQQLYQGVPVFGAELRAHYDAAGNLTVVNGAFVPGINVKATPSRTAEQASKIALAAVNADLGRSVASRVTAGTPSLFVYRAGLAKGVEGANHLAWHVEVGNRVDVREFVLVDAHTGKVIEKISGIHDAKNRRAFNGQGVTAPGPNYPNNPFWVEGNAFPTGTVEADNMIAASSDIHDLFKRAFGRDSFDGKGATMDSIFNRGDSCPNASWNGRFISFCPGTTTDDVTAHEWGHAYTEYTHGLIYQWQPGALNEAYSDIWGETVDRLNTRGTDTPDAPRSNGACTVFTKVGGVPGTDNSVRWLMGEDAAVFGGAIRDMYNPTCYGNPGKVSDSQYRCSTADQGGVHSNSGVPNHGYALLVDGGSYNGQTVFGIGLTKAAHIYYRAQSVYQGPTSGFADHADALQQSCADLSGVNLNDLKTGAASGEIINAQDCAQVAKAALAVELRSSPSQCNFVPLLAKSPPPLCPSGTPTPLLSDNFDGGKRGGVRWVVSHAGNNPEFTPRDFGVVSKLPTPRTGYALFAADADIGTCAPGGNQAGLQRIESPEILIPVGAATPRLSFDHWVATEADWDGGNLKISVNGGAWQLLAASDFVYNAYNKTLKTVGAGNDNPLAGQPAFSGTDGGSLSGSWGRSIVNLSRFAKGGDKVKLRFELGNDGCGGNTGWYLDDVTVYRCTP
ncbi:M4 family metallopeptidase [Paucibacter sp. KBW04]|uniref:M4 family metallopeptidase n=1 Tax=Paucibacter sp. KBW04 TaxID=2153361 RepID=UPI0018CC22BE|nr:M4 family metallopeptidase [Paucibacter sp. KBW04]